MDNQRGFTFIEVLVVAGIVSILAGAFLFIDLRSYRADGFRAERSRIVTQLKTARTDAQNNVGQQPQKVVIHPNGYELAPGSLTEVVFEQLTGEVAHDGEIILVDSQRHATTTISVNHEGRIQ